MSDPVFDTAPGLPRLLVIMARLRDPRSGCPWDIAQDFASIAPYTIEEAYEVADAIAREDMDGLQGELGDLLLQVVYHAQMAAERGAFDFHDVADRVAQKMIERHPHVFGNDSRDKSVEDQTRDWEAAKAAERQASGAARTLDGVALGLPALTRALKLQKRLARVGFDWPEKASVRAKIDEELSELDAATGPGALEDEMGDVLFAVVNLARHLGIDPEAALRRTNAKVETRFRAVEDALAKDGKSPAEASLDEMETHWQSAKS